MFLEYTALLLRDCGRVTKIALTYWLTTMCDVLRHHSAIPCTLQVIWMFPVCIECPKVKMVTGTQSENGKNVQLL